MINVDVRTLHDIAALPDPLDQARAASNAMATLQGQSIELSRIRCQAIVEAQQVGTRQEEIARQLGVTPGRSSQMKKAGMETDAHGPPVAGLPGRSRGFWWSVPCLHRRGCVVLKPCA